MKIDQFNKMSPDELRSELLNCCYSTQWAEKLMHHKPFKNVDSLIKNAEAIWGDLFPVDWIQAIIHHPSIGDIKTDGTKHKYINFLASGGQDSKLEAHQNFLSQLQEATKRYEEKFGFIYVVSLSGKNADDILKDINKRLLHSAEDELKVAVAEQAQITASRLRALIN